MMFSRSARVPKVTCHLSWLFLDQLMNDDPNEEVVVAAK